MKHYFFLLSIIILASCGKGTLSDNSNPNLGNLDYELTGVHDVTLHQHDSTEMTVEMKYLSGNKDIVGLSANNLVQGYVLAFSPQLDTPSFFSTLKIKTATIDTGVKTFQILATGSKKTKAYNINIHVIADTLNPALAFAGSLFETGTCTNNSPNNSLVTGYVPVGSIGKLHLTGLWLGGNAYEVDLYFNGANQSISLPTQVSNGLTFTGSGTYNGTTIQLTYTISGPLVNESCTVTIVK